MDNLVEIILVGVHVQPLEFGGSGCKKQMLSASKPKTG